jgi:hypothetical protein
MNNGRVSLTHARDKRAHEPEPSRLGLQIAWQRATENRDEDDVVDAKDDL